MMAAPPASRSSVDQQGAWKRNDGLVRSRQPILLLAKWTRHDDRIRGGAREECIWQDAYKAAVTEKGYRRHEAWPASWIVLPEHRSSTRAERRWRRIRLRLNLSRIVAGFRSLRLSCAEMPRDYP